MREWRERTQAEEVSEGTESPLKTWGLFKSRREWFGAYGAVAIG